MEHKNDKKIYRSSSAIATECIEENHYAVWNRFFPKIIFLNEDGHKLLEYLSTNRKPYKTFVGKKDILQKMVVGNLIFSEATDPYKYDFINSGEKLLDRIANSMNKHCENKLPYSTVVIFNHRCNLKCPYCIVKYVHNKNHKRINKPTADKIGRLIRCLSNVINNNWLGRIVFNGGEILIEWEMIRSVVEYIKREFPGARVEYDINTNATLVTEDIAKYFAENKFKTIGISIDGYRETHNMTRQFTDGSESFNDVIRAINIINKYAPNPIESFQGTLINKHNVQVNKLVAMNKYGFKRARMGINLLGISKEDAKEMAEKYFKVMISALDNGWHIDDDYAISYKSILNRSENIFTFYCKGFTNYPADILYYNIDTEMVNIACNYATDVQVSLDEVSDNIYHPIIYEKGLRYLRKRFAMIKGTCMNCEIVGICRGGCILKGIDAFNKLNEGGCQFQKEMWKQMLKYIYSKNIGRTQ